VVAENDLVILGSGSLARSVSYSLATVCFAESTVTVVSRTPSSSAEVCYVANVRAALTGMPVRFRPASLEHYSADSIFSILRQARPGILLNCASYQSPWEAAVSPSAWTSLIGRAGFGITLPLQAAIAAEAAGAAASLAPSPLLLNACFPDAVNPLLKAMGLPVFCGVGNVALLAASIRESLGLLSESRLQVLGHHWHLHAPDHDDDEALAWVDGTSVPDVGRLLRGQRAAARAELNFVNGHATALLLAALVAGHEVRASLPGPLGLGGGYPVRLYGRTIELDLPGHMREQAFALNSQWAERDGVCVEANGKVTFSDHIVREIRSELMDFTATVPVRDIPAVCSQLLELREVMRRAPAPSAVGWSTRNSKAQDDKEQ
jgi:hypothetical protein